MTLITTREIESFSDLPVKLVEYLKFQNEYQ
jgi:hypothetical protein